MGNQHPLAMAFETESAIARLLNLNRDKLVGCQALEEFNVLKALNRAIWLPIGEGVFHLFQQEGTGDYRLAGKVPRKARMVPGNGLLFLVAHGEPLSAYGVFGAFTSGQPLEVPNSAAGNSTRGPNGAKRFGHGRPVNCPSYGCAGIAANPFGPGRPGKLPALHGTLEGVFARGTGIRPGTDPPPADSSGNR